MLFKVGLCRGYSFISTTFIPLSLLPRDSGVMSTDTLLPHQKGFPVILELIKKQPELAGFQLFLLDFKPRSLRRQRSRPRFGLAMLVEQELYTSKNNLGWFLFCQLTWAHLSLEASSILKSRTRFQDAASCMWFGNFQIGPATFHET